MQRYYVRCPACGRRMRLLGQSSETFGDPPGLTERYYHCPNCGAQWTHDRERNMTGPGVPDHIAQGGTTWSVRGLAPRIWTI